MSSPANPASSASLLIPITFPPGERSRPRSLSLRRQASTRVADRSCGTALSFAAVAEIEQKLERLGLTLPEPFAPPPGVEFKFDLVRVSGAVAYVSGHLPVD